MYYAHTDGGSRGNPGPGGYGWLLFRDRSLIAYEYGFVGDSTNNQAEYTAMLRLYEYLSTTKLKDEAIEIRCDSQLVVKQLDGEFRVKDPVILKLHQKIESLRAQLHNPTTLRWVARDRNRCADLLVNEALDKRIEPTISENNKSPFAFRVKGLWVHYDQVEAL